MAYSHLDKRDLKGSPNRDSFKHWHKQGASHMYASDLDLVLIDKHPPGIVAALDYKTPQDSVSFSEVILYNKLLSFDIPVFIIISVDPFTTFIIQQFIGGDYKPFPPTVELKTIHKNVGSDVFWAWQQLVRHEYRNKKHNTSTITDEQIKKVIISKKPDEAYRFVSSLLQEIVKNSPEILAKSAW